MVEVEPLCVLDFYVHESCQRQGYGKRLFDFVVKAEAASPARIAYDRPSPKFVAFLAKHFGLRHHRPQTNNFVVFDEFFQQQQQQQQQRAAARGASARSLPDADFDFSLGRGPSARAQQSHHHHQEQQQQPKQQKNEEQQQYELCNGKEKASHRAAALSTSATSSTQSPASSPTSPEQVGQQQRVPGAAITTGTHRSDSDSGSGSRDSGSARASRGERMFGSAGSETALSRLTSAAQRNGSFPWWEQSSSNNRGSNGFDGSVHGRRRGHYVPSHLSSHASSGAASRASSARNSHSQAQDTQAGGLFPAIAGRRQGGSTSRKHSRFHGRAHSNGSTGSGFHDSMSGVGLGLAVRPHAKNSLVHTETTQRIGRHGVRYRGRW